MRPQPERVRFHLDRSFTQQMTELGYHARSRVPTAQTGIVTEEDPQPLRSRLGAGCFRLARLRTEDQLRDRIGGRDVPHPAEPMLSRDEIPTSSVYRRINLGDSPGG